MAGRLNVERFPGEREGDKTEIYLEVGCDLTARCDVKSGEDKGEESFADLDLCVEGPAVSWLTRNPGYGCSIKSDS